MGGCAAFGSGCTVTARLHTAGETEAAEPSAHNGAPKEGEGRWQRGWEPGIKNGGSRGGTKERQERENTGSVLRMERGMKKYMDMLIDCAALCVTFKKCG